MQQLDVTTKMIIGVLMTMMLGELAVVRELTRTKITKY
jgi:hypothetical protein